MLGGNFRNDPSVLLSPDSATPAKFQRKAWVSVGTLPLLRIDDTTVHLNKAGLNLDDKGFLLPLSEHPWRMQCTHSYCVMVELPDCRRLIIPCVDLIRFYFGSSSSLVTKLFLPLHKSAGVRYQSWFSRVEECLPCRPPTMVYMSGNRTNPSDANSEGRIFPGSSWLAVCTPLQ